MLSHLTESKGFTGSLEHDRRMDGQNCYITIVHQLMYDKKYGNTLQMNTYEAQKGQYLYLYHNKEG